MKFSDRAFFSGTMCWFQGEGLYSNSTEETAGSLTQFACGYQRLGFTKDEAGHQPCFKQNWKVLHGTSLLGNYTQNMFAETMAQRLPNSLVTSPNPDFSKKKNDKTESAKKYGFSTSVRKGRMLATSLFCNQHFVWKLCASNRLGRIEILQGWENDTIFFEGIFQKQQMIW